MTSIALFWPFIPHEFTSYTLIIVSNTTTGITEIERRTGVLVIGGGGAACRAAVAAHDAGADVLMVLKGKLGTSGSTAYGVAEMAGFNIADGVADAGDSPAEHARDIMEAGLGMTDEPLAHILAEGAIRAKEELESWGVAYERTGGGKYLSVQSCFSSRPRTHIIRGHGEPIVHALKDQIAKRGIAVLEETMVADLLTENGHCVGALLLSQTAPAITRVRAGAVILGAGGAGSLFRVTLNPADITGDGHAMAYRAGAEMVNMEYMQAAMGFIHPIKNIFNAWLWGTYPMLRDPSGESLLERYLPQNLDPREVMAAKTHYPFSSRDPSRYLEIAVQKEIVASRSPSGRGVRIDFSGVDEAALQRLPEGDIIREMWPITRDWMLARGVDIRCEPVEISTFGHALNGGVRINERAASTIPGLFAAGEVAGGPHGADRLGGNMMVTCQVFGRIAGESAAAYAGADGRSAAGDAGSRESAERLAEILHGKGSTRPQELKQQLADLMYRTTLVVRSRESLQEAAEGIASLRGALDDLDVNGRVESLCASLELESMLTVADLIVKTADLRKESRGSHYREDYPEINKADSLPYFVRYRPEGPEIRPAKYR